MRLLLLSLLSVLLRLPVLSLTDPFPHFPSAPSSSQTSCFSSFHSSLLSSSLCLCSGHSAVHDPSAHVVLASLTLLPTILLLNQNLVSFERIAMTSSTAPNVTGTGSVTGSAAELALSPSLEAAAVFRALLPCLQVSAVCWFIHPTTQRSFPLIHLFLSLSV